MGRGRGGGPWDRKVLDSGAGLGLTNLGGGTFKPRLLMLTSWPLCAQATRRRAT